MIAAEFLAAVSRLGHASFDWFWVPLAHWTVLAMLGLAGLALFRSCHPLTGYRLRQALLVALPLVVLLAPWSPGLAPGVGMLPASETGALPSAATTTEAAGTIHASELGVAQFDPVGLGLGLATLLAALLAIVQLALLIRQLRDLRTVRAMAVPLTDLPARQALQELSHLLRVERRVALLEAPDGAVPLTFHVRRPSILVPRGITATPDRLRTVLAHELVHVRRGDAAWTLVERLVSIPFAFHPLVWVLARRIERLRESSCDAEVVGSGVSGPRSYAELLYDVNLGAGAGLTAVPTLVTRASNLKERVESMKRFSNTPPNGSLRKRSSWAGGLLCLVTVVAGACGSGAPSSQEIGADVAEELTSLFGPMADETRDAALERLDVQMAYLQERVEEVAGQIREVELSGLDPHAHLYEQYQLLSRMYLQRLETYETLKLERETALRLARQ